MEGLHESLHHGNPEENRRDRDDICSNCRPDMDSDSGIDRGLGVLASPLLLEEYYNGNNSNTGNRAGRKMRNL